MSRICITVILLLTWAPQASAAPDKELWSFWNIRDDTSTVALDHSIWQGFLDLHVEDAADGIHRVAYHKAAEETGRAILAVYLVKMQGIDPRQLNGAEQLAYWINLYNALTVQVILNYPRKSSILRMGKAFFSSGPWDGFRKKTVQ